MEGALTTKPTIVVVAYNRPKALHSLLQSLARATYPNDVRLVISIDGGGDKKVIKIATDFNWKFGEKELINRDENLGLRRHVLSCGDLTEKYGSIIMVEDDLEVAEGYYLFAQKALEFYPEADELLAGFSLYHYQISETALVPRYYLAGDKNPAYLMQYPSSWGPMFTPAQWKNYRGWLHTHQNTRVPLPPFVESWSAGSWKKDVLRYLIHQGKYFLYPVGSYINNRGLKGENLAMDMELFEVPLTTMVPEVLPPLEQLTRYDSYFELEPKYLADVLGEEEVIVDVYGSKRLPEIGQQVLSSKPCRAVKTAPKVDGLPLTGSIPGVLYLGPADDFAPTSRVPLVEEALYRHRLASGQLSTGWLRKVAFLVGYRILNYSKVVWKAVRGN